MTPAEQAQKYFANNFSDMQLNPFKVNSNGKK